jgi:phenylalanyl-tRNA synthetase alpha chain
MDTTGGPTPEVLASVEAEFRSAFDQARELDALAQLKSRFFGPKGVLTGLLRSVGKLPPEARREAGQSANRVKQQLEGELEARVAHLEARAKAAELARDRVDLTLPGRLPNFGGGLHPTIRVMEEMIEIFSEMGFSLASGPEVETDAYNFGALNFPEDHPARDMQDTFFVEPHGLGQREDLLLRTHTSPVQIRTMLAEGAPLRIIAPGRVYRCDSDATHSPSFHQIEGLMVDEGVSLAHLKGVLQSFINGMFGEREARFRPSFFPFVEPGVEVDMRCVFCEGAGCRTCKQTGWIEILGAGMVHPAVLESGGVDPERYTGFAFGLGVDRVAMLRYRIDDLGHLFRSEMRFLGQF